jgi:hypothetical protein
LSRHAEGCTRRQKLIPGAQLSFSLSVIAPRQVFRMRAKSALDCGSSSYRLRQRCEVFRKKAVAAATVVQGASRKRP